MTREQQKRTHEKIAFERRAADGVDVTSDASATKRDGHLYNVRMYERELAYAGRY
jgi:hypothetical protein